MDPHDLSEQLKKARTAMTGNRGAEPANFPRAYPEALNRLRRQNLKPDPTIYESPLNAAELEKRRLDARRAMESPEQKAKRLEREQAEATQKLTERRVDELKTARLALEKKRQAEANDFLYQKQKAAEQSQKLYAQKMELAKERIDTIAHDAALIPSNIRTLHSDLLHEVSDPNFSVTKSLMEARAHEKLNKKTTSAKIFNWLTISVIVILVALGTLAIAFAFYTTTEKSITVTPPPLPKLVFTDEVAKINISQKNKEAVLTEISTHKGDHRDALTGVFLLTTITKDSATQEVALDRAAFFAFFGITTPPSFSHFLESGANFGLSSYGSSSVWYILKTRSYEHTFDSLLREGQDIGSGLLSPVTGTDYRTVLSASKAQEGIIKNIDVLIWKNGSTTVLVYGFPTKDTLVIAQNEATFAKLVGR